MKSYENTNKVLQSMRAIVQVLFSRTTSESDTHSRAMHELYLIDICRVMAISEVAIFEVIDFIIETS